jgi:hypothetical protein
VRGRPPRPHVPARNARVARRKEVPRTRQRPAVYPIDGRNYRDLIHQSDIGMYRSKAGGSAPLSFPATAIES